MTLDLSYPRSESKKELFISSCLTGISVYLFLLVFQPFGTNTISNFKLAKILFPYSVIVFSGFYFVNLFIIKKTLKWNLGKEITKTAVIVLLCSGLGYFYNSLVVSKVQLSFVNFLYMLFYACSIGIPVCSVYLLARFIYLNNKNNKSAAELTGKIASKETVKPIFCKNQICVNDFRINEDDLYFIESSDNYCTFYYQYNTEIKKELIRITLKSILEQTRSEKILRSHRSFIVNLTKVISIKGNAQGYILKLQNCDYKIPVSRKYIAEVKSQLNDQ